MKPGLLLFGGSFNPPHHSHRRILQCALRQLDLARAWVVPTGRHPHKGDAGMAPAEHRLAMCRLAFAGMEQVAVSDLETRRDGPSYTVDTLRQVRDQMPAEPLYALIGSDNLPLLPTWREHGEILELATVVTFPRAGAPVDDRTLAALQVDDAKRGELRDHLLVMEPDTVSSSAVRARLAAEAGPLDELEPEVEAYIRRHHLYGT